MLHVLRYVTSFIDGRVRLRHPALRRHQVVAEIQPRILDIAGIRSAEFNERAGSLLLCYDSEILSRDDLIRQALPWASYLDGCLEGQPVLPPAGSPSGECKAAFPVHGKVCWRKMVNRGMLASLAVTAGSLVLGGKRVHVAAGAVFLVLAGMHAWRYRRSL